MRAQSCTANLHSQPAEPIGCPSYRAQRRPAMHSPRAAVNTQLGAQSQYHAIKLSASFAKPSGVVEGMCRNGMRRFLSPCPSACWLFPVSQPFPALAMGSRSRASARRPRGGKQRERIWGIESKSEMAESNSCPSFSETPSSATVRGWLLPVRQSRQSGSPSAGRSVSPSVRCSVSPPSAAQTLPTRHPPAIVDAPRPLGQLLSIPMPPSTGSALLGNARFRSSRTVNTPALPLPTPNLPLSGPGSIPERGPC
jgi:hypothetical protein